MSVARLIDGTAAAARVRERVAQEVKAFASSIGRPPGLAVILVGEDPASAVYVRNKARQTREVGMASFETRCDASVTEDELLKLIVDLNETEEVDGILVQLPLPGHIDEARVIEAILPSKDVDGFSFANVGRLAVGAPRLVPCTPLGCLTLLKDELGHLDGLEAVVVGRSNIVGKPMARLLLAEGCTVTVAHSRTRDLPKIVGRGDIVVAAIGRPEEIRGEWFKPGATVIDVGINRIEAPDKKSRLVGDVDRAGALNRVSGITPVPGGVGPMTIAMLLSNTVMAALARAKARTVQKTYRTHIDHSIY